MNVHPPISTPEYLLLSDEVAFPKAGMKRACDCCIKRKVKCDGNQPCGKCSVSRPQLTCTYLTPARKRGPKSSKDALLRKTPKKIIPLPRTREKSDVVTVVSTEIVVPQEEIAEGVAASGFESGNDVFPNLSERQDPLRVDLDVLRSVIEVYQARMYPVWPVIEANKLLAQLEEGSDDTAYILATSLCAATMVQLHLPPVDSEIQKVSSGDLERECCRLRATCNYRERPNLNHVLTSFFLHVYHAKVDNQNSALLYIQEAILLGRLLKLDDNEGPYNGDDAESVADGCVVYLLLWISERGYAIQYGLPITLQNTASISPYKFYQENVYVEGLFNLARLFVAFDSSSIPQFSRYKQFPVSTQRLVKVEKTLEEISPPATPFEVVQRADFVVTKQWMKILLWQQAMSRGLLSSTSCIESMKFTFPAEVARDLLRWMGSFSTDNLVPLGRDQLVKLFEVTNTLADVILCNPKLSERGHRSLGAADFLHGLYQKISPLLELDPCFNSMLREKTAEALVRTPARLWEIDITMWSEDDTEASEITIQSGFGTNSEKFNIEQKDLEDNFMF